MSDKIDRSYYGLSPFANFIGLKLENYHEGFSQCSLEINDNLLNVHRSAHGGAIYTLADVGMGIALFTMLADNEKCITIEIKINYLKLAVGKLICDSTVIQKGKTIGVIESEIKNNDKLIAKAIGTFSIIVVKE
jgi:acyl-CoA thioesterase